MSDIIQWTIVIILCLCAVAFFVRRAFRKRKDSCCDCPIYSSCNKKKRRS